MTGRGTLVLAAIGFMGVFALAAPVSATSPQAPFEATVMLDREPRTGHPVMVTLRIQANSEVDMQLHPVAPEWVDGGREPWHAMIAKGESAAHHWTFTPTQEGFWGLEFADGTEPAQAGMTCCRLVVYSSASAGRTSLDNDGVLPKAEIDIAYHIETSQDAQTATALYEMDLHSPWLAAGNVTVTWSRGPERGESIVVPHGRPTVVRVPFVLPDSGNGVVTFETSWRSASTWAGSTESVATALLDCRNVSAMRLNGAVTPDGDWTCMASQASSRPGLPVPTPLPLAGLALAALAARWRGWPTSTGRRHL